MRGFTDRQKERLGEGGERYESRFDSMSNRYYFFFFHATTNDDDDFTVNRTKKKKYTFFDISTTLEFILI